MKIWYFLVIILNICLTWTSGAEDTDDVIGSLFKTQVNRVDKDVKRPVRFCQGFEDPAEIDCYMRSDVKSYVCTEPVAFNPCESLQRVETYHYDHITHKCVKMNVPACEGQIIRALSLMQCLIYCHNKDPFALGKSKSMVYKLNQPKPYIPHDKVEDERDKILNKPIAKKSFFKDEDMTNEVISNPKIIKQITKYSTLSYINKPTSKPQNNENTEKKDAKELNVRELNDDVRTTKAPNLNDQKENSKDSEINEIDNKENEDDDDLKNEDSNYIKEKQKNEKTSDETVSKEIKDTKEKKEESIINNVTDKQTEKNLISETENSQKEDRKVYINEIDKESLEDENKDRNIISKLMTKIHQTDSTEKGKDDGFYLWDE